MSSWFAQLQEAAQKAKEAGTQIQQQASALGKVLIDDKVSLSDVLKKSGDEGSDGVLSFDFKFQDGPLGFQLAPDENGLYVSSVDANGQAAGHGVNIGDRLVAVADKPMWSESSGHLSLETVDSMLSQIPRPISLTFAFSESSKTSENIASGVKETAGGSGATSKDLGSDRESGLTASPALLDDGWGDLTLDDDASGGASANQHPSRHESKTAGATDDVSGKTENVSEKIPEHAIAADDMKVKESLAAMASEVVEANLRAEAAERSLAEESSELAALHEDATQKLDGVKMRAREMLERERQKNETLGAQLTAAHGTAEQLTQELKSTTDAKSEMQHKLDQARQQSELLREQLTAAQSEGEHRAAELQTSKHELSSASSSAELMRKQLTVFENLRAESAARDDGAISHDALQQAREEQGKLEMESLRASEAKAAEEASALQVQFLHAEDRCRSQMAKEQNAERELESLKASNTTAMEEVASLQLQLSQVEERCRSQAAKEQEAESEFETWKESEAKAAKEAAELNATLQKQLSQADVSCRTHAQEVDEKVHTLERDLEDMVAKHQRCQTDYESVKDQLAHVQSSFASSEAHADKISEEKAKLASEHAASTEEVHVLSACVEGLKVEMKKSEEELARTRTNLESLLQANQDDGQQHHQQVEDLKAKMVQSLAENEALQAKQDQTHAKLKQSLADHESLQAKHNQTQLRYEGATEQAAKERRNLESELAQSRSEASAGHIETKRFQSLAASTRDELVAFESQSEKLASELSQASLKLQESQQSSKDTQEATTKELRKLRAEASASSTDASRCHTELESTRQELQAAQSRLKFVHGEMEFSKSEHQELLNAGALRDDRVNAAQALLANRIQSLEDQLRTSNAERESAQLRLTELDQQKTCAEEQVKRMTSAATLRDSEHQAAVDVLRSREKDLAANISRLLESSRDAEAQTQEARQCAAEAQARAEASMKQRADDAEATSLRVSQAEAQSSAVKLELERKLENAQADAERFCKEAESHKQLIRSLQSRLAEQEQDHALQLDAKIAELEEIKRKLADQGQAEVSKTDSDANPDENQTERSLGDQTLQASETATKDNSELHAQIDSLERQCSALQKKLNARPIIYRSATSELDSNPLRLEAGPNASSTVAMGSPTMYQLVCDFVEQSLRRFTERLLKRDAFLWVFYVHLLVLYLISGSWLYAGVGSTNPDCLQISEHQSGEQPRGK